MKPPSVYELTTPNIHSTTNTRKIVQSITSSKKFLNVDKARRMPSPGALATAIIMRRRHLLLPCVQNCYSSLPFDVVFGHGVRRSGFGNRRILDWYRGRLVGRRRRGVIRGFTIAWIRSGFFRCVLVCSHGTVTAARSIPAPRRRYRHHEDTKTRRHEETMPVGLQLGPHKIPDTLRCDRTLSLQIARSLY